MAAIIHHSKQIINGTMGLTSRQQDRVLNYALDLYDATRKSCGYVQGQQRNSLPSYTRWLLDRYRWSKMYEGDFSHRASADELFAMYNTSFNVPQRAIRVWKSKANKKLLGTEPFCSLKPEGKEDQDPAVALVDRYFSYLLEEAQAKYVLQEAMEAAGIRGEAIIKITQQVKEIYSNREVQVVLVGGQELRDTSGRVVYFEEGQWEPDPESPNPHQRRLITDPNIRIIGEPGLSNPMKKPAIERRTGLDFALVPYQDFFCDTTAPNIHDCDGIFHAYNLDVDELLSRAAPGKLAAEARAWLDKVRNIDNFSKVDSRAAQDNQGEEEIEMDKPGKVGMFEGWMRFDADEDGRAEEMQVVCDYENKQLVFADYMGEVSPTGKRPFEDIRLMKQPNRWFGIGFYKLLENQHEFVDRQRNRIDSRSGTGGRIMWQKRGAIADSKYGIPLEFNSDRVFTVEDGFEGKDAFGAFEAPPMVEVVENMMEKELMSAQLISGTLTPADGEFSNAPSNETATGQQFLAEESDTLNEDSLQFAILGIVNTLKQGATIGFGSFDVASAADEMGPENAALLQEWVSTQPVRNFSRRVKLLMTRTRTQEVLAQNSQVVNEILPVWDTYPAQQKIERYDIFIEMLNALDVENPETVLGDKEQLIAQAEIEAMIASGIDPATGRPAPITDENAPTPKPGSTGGGGPSRPPTKNSPPGPGRQAVVGRTPPLSSLQKTPGK